MAFCVVDMLPREATRGSWIPRFTTKDEKSAAMANFVIVAATLGSLVSNPGQFLSEGPGINAFVHAIAFLGGYLSSGTSPAGREWGRLSLDSSAWH